ncbi:MAG: hypothetical protein WC307_04965 [Candidatus Nanoarchaeia archaeon]|jgi:hypothetical protein
MSDFISNDLIEIQVFDKVFKIKEMNGKDYDLMTNDSMKYDSESNSFRIDLSAKNLHYLKLVMEAPYPEFQGKDVNARIELLNNLKPVIRKELLKQIKAVIDSESDVLKK